MICRWVIDSRLATLGRRIVITTAVFGLTTVGSTGIALGVADTIGRSPSAKVVSRAPMAVSVTFRESLRGGGARIRILTDDGDVGTGKVKVTADRKILKRELRLGAPAGPYTVLWSAVSAQGRKMSGEFSFRAARSNGEVERTSPVSSSSAVAAPPSESSTDGSAITGSSTGAPGYSGTGRSVSTGFTVIPLTVGGLLVLAAGMVSLINRHRPHG